MNAATVRILLVDDDEVDIMTIQRSFRKNRIANPVTVAHDGLEALELLREEDAIPRPVVVLLDLNMPRMNGHQFLDEIRSDPELQDLVVFVLTTSSDDEDMAAAYAHNVAGYIVKKQAAAGFLTITDMLKAYWRVVEFPVA